MAPQGREEGSWEGGGGVGTQVAVGREDRGSNRSLYVGFGRFGRCQGPAELRSGRTRHEGGTARVDGLVGGTATKDTGRGTLGPMVETTLIASALLVFAAAAIYYLSGFLLGNRDVPPDLQLHWTMFTLWWLGIGTILAVVGLREMLAGLGAVDLALFATFELVKVTLFVFAIWCLTNYLIHLFYQERKVSYPVAVFYLFYYILLVFPLFAGGPTGVEIRTWHTVLQFEQTLPGDVAVAYWALYVVPPLLAAFYYLSFYFVEREPTVKYRTLLVSAGIFLWSLSFLFLAAPFFAADAPQLVVRVGLLLSAVLIYLAYHPPQAVKARYRVRSVLEQGG